MNKIINTNYWVLLVVIALVITVMAYIFYQPQNQVFETKISYTVVPQTAVLRGNYQDLQASNLFIDVIKAWVYSPSIQGELNSNLINSNLTSFRSTSMQTFEITAMGETAQSATEAVVYIDNVINREVIKHAKLSGTGGYVLIETELHETVRSPKILLNISLVFLTTFIIGGFLILLFRYKPQY